MMSASYSYSYVIKTLAGVSFFMRMTGANSCMQFFAVKCALKGYRKKRLVTNSRLPISAELLDHIGNAADEICFSPYEALFLKLAFSLCFFGAFRVSELIPHKNGNSSGLLFNNVTLNLDSLSILLRKSKMDSMGQGR